ncbi:aminopeptidase N-like [Ixodes scapularis]
MVLHLIFLSFYARSLLSFTVRNVSTINKHLSDSASFFFESATFSRQGTELALGFLVDNWKSLLAKYGQGPSLRDTVWYTLQSIRSSDSLNRMEHFYAEKVKTKKNARKLAPTFQSALELARTNMNWVAKNGRTIEKWIDGRLVDGAAPGA